MKNQIACIITGREKDIGIRVQRVLPWAKKRMVGPFIFLDEMGPTLLKAPEDHMDVRPHPHIGLSTLTYLFEGEIMHRDSLGVEQLIVPGEVNWMTAGKGVSHSEREPASSRTHDRKIHGLQFWVALPKSLEEIDPSFFHYEKEDIPEIIDDTCTINVVAGKALGKVSNLRSYSPMTFLVVRAKKPGSFTFHEENHETAVYVVQGEVSVDGQTHKKGEMIVFSESSALEVTFSQDALFAVIGGEAFPEPRYIWWNLVSSDVKKIEKAKQDWIDGTFPQVPGDHERIPAPQDPLPQVASYP